MYDDGRFEIDTNNNGKIDYKTSFNFEEQKLIKAY